MRSENTKGMLENSSQNLQILIIVILKKIIEIWDRSEKEDKNPQYFLRSDRSRVYTKDRVLLDKKSATYPIPGLTRELENVNEYCDDDSGNCEVYVFVCIYFNAIL